MLVATNWSAVLIVSASKPWYSSIDQRSRVHVCLLDGDLTCKSERNDRQVRNRGSEPLKQQAAAYRQTRLLSSAAQVEVICNLSNAVFSCSVSGPE